MELVQIPVFVTSEAKENQTRLPHLTFTLENCLGFNAQKTLSKNILRPNGNFDFGFGSSL